MVPDTDNSADGDPHGETIEPADFFAIAFDDAIALLSSAVKLRVFEKFVRQPLTVAEVAERLGVSAAAVNFHAMGLATMGAIRKVGVRPTSTRPAAVYRASGHRVSVVDRQDSVELALDLHAAAAKSARTLGKDAADGVGATKATTAIQLLAVSPEDADRFLEELDELVSKYRQLDPGVPSDQPPAELYFNVLAWRSDKSS